MIGLPLEFIDRTDSGSILSRFHNITEIQNQGINMILSMVLDTILAIVGAIILCSISPIFIYVGSCNTSYLMYLLQLSLFHH